MCFLGCFTNPMITFFFIVLQEGIAPINLIVEHELHRATPGGTGGVKTIGNYAAVRYSICLLVVVCLSIA